MSLIHSKAHVIRFFECRDQFIIVYRKTPMFNSNRDRKIDVHEHLVFQYELRVHQVCFPEFLVILKHGGIVELNK